jgi:hypothetical protein
LIGLIYLMARDGEMPKAFTRLNSHGFPDADVHRHDSAVLVVAFRPTNFVMEL